MKRCWAEILGGCSKQPSSEHYVGKGLFESVTTHGLHSSLDGRSLPVSNLKANILCKKHNNRLSVVDEEVIHFHERLRSLFQRQEKEVLLSGNSLWTPEQYKINALLFGRWLCKLHCNFLTLGGINSPEYYVRYAFGEHTTPAPRFYLRVQSDDVLGYQQRVSYANFSGGSCKQDEYGTFHVFFMGFHFIVCPYDLTRSIKVKLTESTGDRFYMGDWMDKPRKICLQQHSLAVKSFVFDWGD
jgi:hypothetical protein